MEQITVVIGDRLGKGQKVAAGVEKAGGRAACSHIWSER